MQKKPIILLDTQRKIEEGEHHDSEDQAKQPPSCQVKKITISWMYSGKMLPQISQNIVNIAIQNPSIGEQISGFGCEHLVSPFISIHQFCNKMAV